MKKLLLTLGTAAIIATPLIAVVACERFDDDIQVIYDSETKVMTATNVEIENSSDDDDFEDLGTSIKDRVMVDPTWGEATSIILKGEFADTKLEKTICVTKIKNNDGTETQFTTLEEVLNYNFSSYGDWSQNAILGWHIFEGEAQ